MCAIQRDKPSGLKKEVNLKGMPVFLRCRHGKDGGEDRENPKRKALRISSRHYQDSNQRKEVNNVQQKKN